MSELTHCSINRAANCRAQRRIAVSKASKSICSAVSFPMNVLISAMISALNAFWSPFFRLAPAGQFLVSAVGHRPTARKLANKLPNASEIQLPLQSVGALTELALS